MLKSLFFALFLGLTACQSTPGGNVQLGPSYPKGNCDEVGQVIGTSGTRKNARENAREDMRREAAKLQGNYVRVIAESAHGAAVRGIAYRCY